MADILLVLREGYDGWALGVKEDDPIGGGGMVNPPFKDDIPETRRYCFKTAITIDADDHIKICS